MSEPRGLEINIRTPIISEDALVSITVNGKRLDIENARRFVLIVERDRIVTYTLDYNAPEILEIDP